ncbi:hypothetical protein ACNKHP_13395 [Shigella boydii]
MKTIELAVLLPNWTEFAAKAVVLTVGTFLDGKIHIGRKITVVVVQDIPRPFRFLAV